MIETGFESRVKVQQIIDSQLPEFVLDESPKTSEFLKQYYISQEYQGGTIDIVENLDQYINLNNLTSELIAGNTSLTQNVSLDSKVISVLSTRGFPQKYGLIKIDDEIITYTGLTTNTFTGCIRGFSGIISYHDQLNTEELVFKTSKSASHASPAKVENLSVLFLKEFYQKIKYNLTPGLENLNFTSELNVGTFIKEAKALYETKGTNESFRILFNVLYGKPPQIVDLENYLIKPSSANYVRRKVIIADSISGNPLLLAGETIFKSKDPKSSASVSEVEVIQRKGKTYYKLLIFSGYDNAYPTITGTFNITSSTRNINLVSVGSSIITVDSTIGFSTSGKIYALDNEISYTDKTINQFLGCTGVQNEIPISSLINSDETYYGYENGDSTKKVEIRITGTLANHESVYENSKILPGDEIGIKYVGELITNPETNSTYKQIFSNSWIYNTSSRYQIDSFSGGTISQMVLKSTIDKSSLKLGDYIDILSRNSNTIIFSNLKITKISNNEIFVNQPITLNQSFNYDIRRKLNVASSSHVPLEYNSLFPEIQNLYNENDEFMYIAANSLPSYQIGTKIFSYDAYGVTERDQFTGLYSTLVFSSKVSFVTGNEIYYKPSNLPISGLVEGLYFVEVLPDNFQIRLYTSKSVIGTQNYVYFGDLTGGYHNFTLYQQKEKIISYQKLLRKFPLKPINKKNGVDVIVPGSVGMLINGVEILSYKSNDKIYYGSLQKINVLNGGENYDVINPPNLSVSSGSAKIQPIVVGSIEKIYVTPQNFDVDVNISISVTGGNGSGAVFKPIIERKRREIVFDAREIGFGGGVDTSFETITFNSNHGLIDGEAIIYRPGKNSPLGIGSFLGNNFVTGKTLKSESKYYAKYISDTTIQLYQSYNDYISGINTVGFTTAGTSGIQKFVTEPKNTLNDIKVIDGGFGYANRKLIVSPSGISTSDHTVTFTNHGFETGEIVVYEYETSQISGLSTSNQYYVVKIDNDKFRVVNAGVGGTYVDDYQRGKYVKFNNTGTGYQIFNYPKINLKVSYSSVGLGSTQFRGSIEATPVIRGKIATVYVYDSGVGYGSSILNYHKKPSIIIKTGKEAQIKPVIVNGSIVGASVQYSGSEYYSNPELKVIGSGIGASLKPVVVNNKIVNVIVINPGAGYSQSDTFILVEPSGKNAIFDPVIRSLTANLNVLYNDKSSVRTAANEIIKNSYNKLQYSICGYSENIQEFFDDNSTTHSPIIGWAYDGNPIYGSYGYSDPYDKNSNIKRITPSYSLNSNNVSNRPSTSQFPEGFFIEDYQYTNSGDLDEHNGRFCVTPEFPNGIYAYFATSTADIDGFLVGTFPYFVGNSYKSQEIKENKTLNQSFNFNSSRLIRNTFPYKVADEYADNDFISESNEIKNQVTVVESVTSGSVENFKIVKTGDNYRVGDKIIFDEAETGGGGLNAEISEIRGKNILNINTSADSYNNCVFVWESGESVKVAIPPTHQLKNLDYVNVSGFSTQLSSLNGYYQIGITSYSSILLENLQNYSTTGIVTDILVSNIPKNISIGSSIKIESEILKILNIFKSENVIRVSREVAGAAHTATTHLNFIPDYFTIKKYIGNFKSDINYSVFFNPKESIGIGTTPGSEITKLYKFGRVYKDISIPTQSIYIPDHKFYSGQEVIFSKPSSSYNFSVSNTSTGSVFGFPANGDSQKVYIVKQSENYIGIVTQIGLTTSTKGLFFTSDGSDDYTYSIQSNFSQIAGNVDKIYSTVTVEKNHNLLDGDKINLTVKPSSSVGIGTSSSVRVTYNTQNKKIIINPTQFSSTGINTIKGQITINNHLYNTGDKVFYNSTIPAVGLYTGFYYVYSLNSNEFKLCETLVDSQSNPPRTIAISSAPTATHTLGLVNPEILSFKNNNLVFDLTDSSVSGYKLKIFFDENLTDEFVSTGTTNSFSVTKVTNGISTLQYSEGIPETLYYSLEKSGIIVSPDEDVKNYSKINFIDSYYNNSYVVSGVGSTTFSLSLPKKPESNYYQNINSNSLYYTTNSKYASGSVEKIKTISPGSGYDILPTFVTIESINGSGAYIIPKSSNIGKINQIKIVNEGFEYSSDKTLRPESLIPTTIGIKNANTVSSVEILNGGKNYTSSPELLIINSETQKINSTGKLIANLNGTSIDSVSIVESPRGLSESSVNIVSVNNSNGIGIQYATSSSSGIVTCTLMTPLSGFNDEPFSVGDKIFVEGISIVDLSGDGVNSENYNYQFFTVVDYLNSGTSYPRILKYRVNNPGIANTTQNFKAKIINYKNYPKFNPITTASKFIVGEFLNVNTGNGFIETELKVLQYGSDFIKISGYYDLRKNQIVKGKTSGCLATIDTLNTSKGIFNVDYGFDTNFNWSDNIGILNDDSQVIPDNDYYQNLSYSLKSEREWAEIISPVNNILHTAGLKNFSDTQILNTVSSSSTITAEYTTAIYDILEENRVDTINNFDLSIDVDVTSDGFSGYLKLKNKKLASYIECLTNRVLSVDDISSEFSNSNEKINKKLNIATINSSKKYEKYLLQISNSDYSQIQFNEIVVLSDVDNTYLLDKAVISNSEYPIVKSYVYTDPASNQNYLSIEPYDPNNFVYDIKILTNSFTNFNAGIGSTSLGCINLLSRTLTAQPSQTVTLLEYPISTTKSVYSEIHLKNTDTDEMEYFEVFLDHDGTNTNISELYFDSTAKNLNSNQNITFTSNISGSVLTLQYNNTSNNSITISSKNVGFGSTSAGIGTYRFLSPGQASGTEKTVKYESLYSNVSSASTIFSFDSSIFTSVKSTIRVSIGQSSALHQVAIIANPTNVYVMQYPFLSVENISGVGTFGGELAAGGIASLKFYPDPSLSGNFEIISFNQVFYSKNDYENIPAILQYGNLTEYVNSSRFIGANSEELNKFKFDLNYQGVPIFSKVFDPSNSSVLNLSTGEFNIPNHFFSTGEELIYTPNSTFPEIQPSSVGIGSTLNHAGIITNVLPSKLYAIKIDNSRFKLSTRREYSLASPAIAVTFTSYGSGNAHELEMYKKNEKSIITIDNVIQSPISYSKLNYTVNNGGQIGTASSVFGISGISSVLLGDFLKIDEEYMKVSSVGLGTTYSGPIDFSGSVPLVGVIRGAVGSSATAHSDSSLIKLYRGSYNIVKNSIIFSDSPIGGLKNQLTENLSNLPDARSSFTGRVFLKKNYDDNKIFDDISGEFTGIGQTYRLTVSGMNTIGVGSDGANALVFINGIFQTPTTQNNSNNNFIISEDTQSGISSIIFTGITSSNGMVAISDSDVNLNELPRGGLIVSVGSTSGLGFAPLVGASVTAVVSSGSIVSVGIGSTGNWGSGYRNPVSVAVTEYGHTGNQSIITASVGAGGTLAFTIVNGGTGYTNPKITISPPNYENLPVTGVSRIGVGNTTKTGTGLLVNLEVGSISTTGIGSTLFEVKSFKISRSGFDFRPGDVVKPVGLVTGYGLSSPISDFQITVLDTFSDSFYGLQFGELDYIDSIKLYQNGSRTRFPLYYKTKLLSFEKNNNNADSQLIDFDSLLVIFINGILQKPKDAYQFDGGTSFTFSSPPNSKDDISIFFYRGSSNDSRSVDVNESIKVGDDVQQISNNNYLNITTTQNLRVVDNIPSSDRIQTTLYNSQGIDIDNYKPLNWSKQKIDRIIDGAIVSKARESIESQIYPTSKIISNLSTNSTEMFVDNAEFFNYENNSPVNFDGLIVSGKTDPVSAAVTAIVSLAGTIQSLVVNNVGSGYTGSSVTVKISSPKKIGLGIGTTATATIPVLNGSLSSPVTIVNPGFGYTSTTPPNVIVPLPAPIYENITDVTTIQGFSGKITGIQTCSGIGTNLGLRFTISSNSALSSLVSGYLIYIFNTKVGNGVTSIIDNDSKVIGIGTTCLDNIYYVSSFSDSTGIVTCNIHSQSSVVGIATTGSIVGNFSWGRLSGFKRSTNPISIGVSGFTVNSGLSSFPTIQRRGSGFNDNGSLKYKS